MKKKSFIGWAYKDWSKNFKNIRLPFLGSSVYKFKWIGYPEILSENLPKDETLTEDYRKVRITIEEIK